MDVLYHTMVALHERLPEGLGFAAACAVCFSSARAWQSRLNFTALQHLAQEAPREIQTAFDIESQKLGLKASTLSFLPVDQPLCFALDSKTVVASQGFFIGLDSQEIEFVVRHELLHLKRRDPLRGILWHVFFAGLLFPAFGGIERKLSLRREQCVHQLAAASDPIRYTRLLRRASFRQALCVKPEAAKQSKFASTAPVFALVMLAGLMYSHVIFLETLQYLIRHHC
jgi:hypothetical protein